MKKKSKSLSTSSEIDETTVLDSFNFMENVSKNSPIKSSNNSVKSQVSFTLSDVVLPNYETRHETISDSTTTTATKTGRNSSGLGFSSLGMSALFYSFLKNSQKNSAQNSPSPSSTPPIASSHSHHETKHMSQASFPPYTNHRNTNTNTKSQSHSLPPVSSAIVLGSDNNNSKRAIDSSMSSRASPLTQNKLRSLQEAIVSQYPKEQLTSLGIVVPNTVTNQASQFSVDSLLVNKGSLDKKISLYYQEIFCFKFLLYMVTKSIKLSIFNVIF